jgi:hypothetical protein
LGIWAVIVSAVTASSTWSSTNRARFRARSSIELSIKTRIAFPTRAAASDWVSRAERSNSRVISSLTWVRVLRLVCSDC